MMEHFSSHTDCAPAERADSAIIKGQCEYFRANPPEAQSSILPIILMILNRQRQVIYSNESLLSYLKTKGFEDIISLRPGEILGCMHAFETQGGCGTTKTCRTCGTMKAIAAAQNGLPDVEECRILKKETGDALDFRIWASPINVNQDRYVILSMTDISDEKRRRALERIFFHDILNTAGGLKGIIDLITDPDYKKKEELFSLLPRLAERLIDEINAQRELAAAESNELVIKPSLMNSVSVIEDVAEIYLNHQVVREKLICVDQNAVPADFISDRTLIMRVIGNMVKNALEATKAGGAVTISCNASEDMVEFSVHNDSYIPENVQLQIFQRSFSTKAKDRGLGTYSMKLLSERYLKGKVRFNSTESMGTTFYIRVPINYLPQKDNM